MTMLTEQSYRRRALIMTAVAMVLVFILWNVREVRFILYPLNLFTTYVHEAGHAIATLLTGGRVLGFLVSADGSGLTTRAGGADWIVGPAGYLGAAFFGSVLFFVVNRFPRFIHAIGVALGVGMVVFTVLFARPDEGGFPIALLIGVLAGMGLMALGLRAPLLITLLVLNVLAITTALNAFLDLQYLMTATDASRGNIPNDAAQFAQRVTPLIPASVIAFIWATLAVMMFGTALYYGAWRPLRDEIDTTYESIKRR